MNCLEFRRVVAADPRHRSSALAAHAAACTACAGFLRTQRDADHQMRAVLEVPVPAGLADRVLYARAAKAQRHRSVGRMAVAASLLAALAISYLAMPGTPTAAAIAGHVGEERLSSAPSDAGADLGLARRALALGGTVSGLEVLRVNLCLVGGRPVLHFVMAGEHGPVDVLVMPGSHMTLRTTVSRQDVGGWIAPGANCDVAVLGTGASAPSEADLGRALRAIQWRPSPTGWPGAAFAEAGRWVKFLGFVFTG